MLRSARRTHTCGELRSENVGQPVLLQGWVDGFRNLGGVTFIDLRDRHGVTQVTVDQRSPEAIRAYAEQVRMEFVVEIEGEVRLRENPNARMPTGLIEVTAHDVRILSRTPALPFSIQDDTKASEEVRLRYRFLDLRRPSLARNLVTRHRMALAVRRYLDTEGFIEVETPILGNPTPEGARDYLVPSRVHAGHWYALPQSPQIYKQILMVAGMDRYFQIVKCFRDEDLRADRQPEFTQIDIEMSFATCDVIIEVAEGVVRTMWKEILDYEVPPISRITYAEALDRFGLDAPDLRFGMEHSDLGLLAGTAFGPIAGALAAGGICKGMCVKGAAADTSRKVLDEWSLFTRKYGLGGVISGKVASDGIGGGLGKLSPTEQQAVMQALHAEPGDLILVAAGPAAAVHAGLGRLRVQIARERKLIPEGVFAFTWIVDFPSFEWDKDEQRWAAVHHPFTSPLPEHIALLGTGREAEMNAAAYDIVCNGYEIGGGSVRIHDPDVQARVFAAIGLTAEEANHKFGYLLEALRHGAPPHAGLAFGFDRCTMLLSGTENIREVIAFPKTSSAQDLMSGAPSPVAERQLKELYVRNTE